MTSPTDTEPPEPTPSGRAVGAGHAALVALGMGLLFGLVYGGLALRAHRSGGTWGFDLGIYDQAFWLASRGRSFMTIRGMELWGHHVNLVAFLYAPFYWLGAGAGFLGLSQAIVIGQGAVPVHLIARDRFGSDRVGLLFAGAYLLMPATAWLTWDNFHPEALAPTLLLWLWWSARRGHWRRVALFALLALSLREDVALVLALLGVGLWWVSRRDSDDAPVARRTSQRVALGAVVVGFAWFLVCMKAVIPSFNDGAEPFYIKWFYGDFGSSALEVVVNMARRPGDLLALALKGDRIRFAADLFLPLGGLPLLQLPVLLAAGPQALVTIAGSKWFLRDVRFQYTALMIAPLLLSAIEGAAWMVRRAPRARRIVLGWLALCTLVAAFLRSPIPYGPNAWQWVGPSARGTAIRHAASLIPSGAGVAATDGIVPQLAHREHVYELPNPFVSRYFGADGRGVADPANVDWIAAEITPDMRRADRALIERLTRGEDAEFEVVWRSGTPDVLVARRR